MREAFIITAALLAACASLTPPIAPTLDEVLADPRVSHLEARRTQSGLLTVPVALNGQDAVPFLVDTGATRSVVFSDRTHGLDLVEDGEVRVHGIGMKRVVRRVRVDRLRLGTAELRNVKLAVLPPREGLSTGVVPHGILGMDFLGDYRLYSRGENDLALIPDSVASPQLPNDWSLIELSDNPFLAEGESDVRGLHFLTVRMNGQVATALLDFGSDANIANYAFATFPEIRQMRRRLRERYEMQGASGAFSPRMSVEGVNFRAGSRVWRNEDFVVLDLDSLDVIGVEDQPFMIAGASLFADRSFFLDFDRDVLRMPRSDWQIQAEGVSAAGQVTVSRLKPRPPRTGSRVGSASATVTPTTPEAHSR